MSLTVCCRRRLRIYSVTLVLIFCVLVYIIYSGSTPGGYGQWSNWSHCSKTCGEGLRSRSRKCDSPKPGIIGKDCPGPSSMTSTCQIVHCPIDGGFTEWDYGKCDKNCGGGIMIKTRSCRNPVPQYEGKPCRGAYMEQIKCNVQPCPVNGGYSAWGAFSTCEITGDKKCGRGKRVRTRACNKPAPQHGGKRCEGAYSETAECEIACTTTAPPSTTASLNTTSTDHYTKVTRKPKTS